MAVRYVYHIFIPFYYFINNNFFSGTTYIFLGQMLCWCLRSAPGEGIILELPLKPPLPKARNEDPNPSTPIAATKMTPSPSPILALKNLPSSPSLTQLSRPQPPPSPTSMAIWLNYRKLTNIYGPGSNTIGTQGSLQEKLVPSVEGNCFIYVFNR